MADFVPEKYFDWAEPLINDGVLPMRRILVVLIVFSVGCLAFGANVQGQYDLESCRDDLGERASHLSQLPRVSSLGLDQFVRNLVRDIGAISSDDECGEMELKVAETEACVHSNRCDSFLTAQPPRESSGGPGAAAIAYCIDTGSAGVGFSSRTDQDQAENLASASTDALDKCQAEAGSGGQGCCKVMVRSSSQFPCVALAKGSGSRFGTGSGDAQSEAVRNAKSDCGGGYCEPAASRCTN